MKRFMWMSLVALILVGCEDDGIYLPVPIAHGVEFSVNEADPKSGFFKEPQGGVGVGPTGWHEDWWVIAVTSIGGSDELLAGTVVARCRETQSDVELYFWYAPQRAVTTYELLTEFSELESALRARGVEEAPDFLPPKDFVRSRS